MKKKGETCLKFYYKQTKDQMIVRDLPFSQWQKSRHSFNHKWQRILVIVYFLPIHQQILSSHTGKGSC